MHGHAHERLCSPLPLITSTRFTLSACDWIVAHHVILAQMLKHLLGKSVSLIAMFARTTVSNASDEFHLAIEPLLKAQVSRRPSKRRGRASLLP